MRSLEINPGEADTISNIGTFHLAEGQINEAVAAYRARWKSTLVT
jgi:hypothetical protein